MTALSVNINKIALLRNSREGNYPSLIEFAKLAIDAGANGITVHPRPDQRHIRVDDCDDLQHMIKAFNQANANKIEFNIEGNPFAQAKSSGNNTISDYHGLLTIIEKTLPDQATLVPDNNAQLTSDHGFNLKQDAESLEPIILRLKKLSVRSSLFMDPDCEQIKLASELGADRIELYTGPYALAHKLSPSEAKESLQRYKKASDYAQNLGLQVNAGHDLNLQNLEEFLNMGNIAEVSIGHALTVDALIMGYKTAIQRYSNICTMG